MLNKDWTSLAFKKKTKSFFVLGLNCLVTWPQHSTHEWHFVLLSSCKSKSQVKFAYLMHSSFQNRWMKHFWSSALEASKKLSQNLAIRLSCSHHWVIIIFAIGPPQLAHVDPYLYLFRQVITLNWRWRWLVTECWFTSQWLHPFTAVPLYFYPFLCFLSFFHNLDTVVW